MKTIVEVNKRFGHGYQAKLINGPLHALIDDEPYNLIEILSGTEQALEEINKSYGTEYQLHEVLNISIDALEANKHKDFFSAKMLQDITSGKNFFMKPSQEDFKDEDAEDGEDEIPLSAQALVIYVCILWKEEGNPNAERLMKKYCQELASQGYGKRAAKIFRELRRMPDAEAFSWVKETYDRYVTNDWAIMRLMEVL